MICYRDTTFCINPACTCGRALTDEIREAARKWLGKDDPPISVAWLCGSGPCACCGAPDARHRIADRIVERWDAGDDTDRIVSDYWTWENKLTPEAVRRIASEWEGEGNGR